MGKILAQDLKSILLGANVPIQAAYVFGSAAKGTAKPNSDIDIAVWCLNLSVEEKAVDFS